MVYFKRTAVLCSFLMESREAGKTEGAMSLDVMCAFHHVGYYVNTSQLVIRGDKKTNLA